MFYVITVTPELHRILWLWQYDYVFVMIVSPADEGYADFSQLAHSDLRLWPQAHKWWIKASRWCIGCDVYKNYSSRLTYDFFGLNLGLTNAETA